MSEYVECPVCHKEISLTRKGEFRSHGKLSETYGICPASEFTPDEVVKRLQHFLERRR